MKFLMLLTLATAVSACGGQPGPQAGETYFWKVESSVVNFVQCSDAQSFRKDIRPIASGTNVFFIYRVESDGKKATLMDCTTLSASSCQPAANNVIFDVAGPELLMSRDVINPVGTTGCNVTVAQSWVLEDQGQDMTLNVTDVLGLSGSETNCPQVENTYKSQSTNGFGLEGCLIGYTVKGKRR